MPRPPRERIIDAELPKQQFRPYGASRTSPQEVVLSLDEAEALRLADVEGLYQQAAAKRMGISRTTFGRIIESARRKTADSILNGKKLKIEGGLVSVGASRDGTVCVAVPVTATGAVEAHFGRCRRVAVFSVAADGRLATEKGLEVEIGPGCKSSVFAELASRGVSALVAGCIGDGAMRIGASHGITVLRGAAGAATTAAAAFARGELVDSGLRCDRACMGNGKGCR
jgi:predicted DNA-binding protein (UPF0251 family)/predicted Fe-Mo cluster-binding NifX family protein